MKKNMEKKILIVLIAFNNPLLDPVLQTPQLKIHKRKEKFKNLR